MRTLRLGLLPALVICCGCAVLNPENRRTFNFVKQTLVPRYEEPNFWQYCVLVPAGLGAVTLDTFIVHPAMVLDDAWDDTAALLWSRFEWEDHYVTECALLPLRAATTPLVYVPIWLFRAAFDVSESEEQPSVEVPPPPPDTPKRRLPPRAPAR